MTVVRFFKATVNKLFTRYLLLTNSSIGVFFLGAGDAIQQFLEKKLIEEKPFDFKRNRNMLLSGLVYGPLGHVWYKFLDTKFPGTKTKTIAKKLGCEMAIGPPLVMVIFVVVGALEGKPVKKSLTEFKDNLLAICAMDWAFYTPLQALNFYFLPPRYRVLYVCSITLVYDVFLSYVIHKEDIKEKKLAKIEVKNE